jgi:hypothetical protein
MPGIPDPGSQVGRHCAAAGASKAVAANSEERRGARAEFMGARGGDRGPCRNIAARQNRVTARSDRWLAAARQERPHGGDGTASQGLALAPGEGIGVVRACRKFKHRSRTTRDPPPQSCPLRAPPSIRPQPPARTDPRPHAAAFPPREHTAPPPRPASGRDFAPHRHSAALPSSAASPCAAGGARHPDGLAPAAVRPSAASTRAIAARSWIAASTRRGPAHCGQTSTSMPNTRRSRSAHGKRCRRLRRRLPRCGTRRRARARRSACWRRTTAAADVAVVAALSAPAT